MKEKLALDGIKAVAKAFAHTEPECVPMCYYGVAPLRCLLGYVGILSQTCF